LAFQATVGESVTNGNIPFPSLMVLYVLFSLDGCLISQFFSLNTSPLLTQSEPHRLQAIETYSQAQEAAAEPSLQLHCPFKIVALQSP
jgi:hypothetical protein